MELDEAIVFSVIGAVAGWLSGLLVKGRGPLTHPLLLTIRNWRALFDGRYMYGTAIQDKKLVPTWLYDFKQDPLNLENRINRSEDQRLQTEMHQQLLNLLGFLDFRIHR